jgi:muramoyltetrapeptide carboxypeptidase
MPVNIPDASAKSLESLRKALFGEEISYEFNSHALNRSGNAKGVLIGGNLSLLAAVTGSVSDADYNNKILFIEDVGEYLYAIDRMIRMLDRAGKLNNLAGLIVGGFTGIKDNDIPFGQTVEQIVMDVVKKYDYPVCFDFPAGHIPDNRSIVLGRRVYLSVHNHEVTVKYL